MSDIRYRRGRTYAADMAAYARLMAEDNSQELSVIRQNLARALREDITARQREVLYLYYQEQMNMGMIAAHLGVERSTISRTIKRAEARLRRCLRYGAASFLNQSD